MRIVQDSARNCSTLHSHNNKDGEGGTGLRIIPRLVPPALALKDGSVFLRKPISLFLLQVLLICRTCTQVLQHVKITIVS